MAYSDLRKGRHSQAGQVYHVTTITRDRKPFFTDWQIGRAVVRELMKVQEEGYAETLCFVLMPNHFHWLMALRQGTLGDVMRRVKGRSARSVGYPLWQPNFHDHALRQEEDLIETARYVVANPLRAGLVTSLREYGLWDSVWLS